MSMIESRLIGLSDEVALERQAGVEDLHIGWQVEEESQQQPDPDGRIHIAPVVRWKQDGVIHRHVPVLGFREDPAPEAKLRRFFGLPDLQRYVIDREKLLADIEESMSAGPALAARSRIGAA